MKAVFKIALLATAVAIVSCKNDKKPNYQYFPNMYESVGYEAYSSHDNEIFAGNYTSEALIPVEGTVSRGWLPYDYDNNREGYLAAKTGLKNPLPYTQENAEKGKALYDIYCAICHGGKGNGKGTLVKREKILGVPSYDDAGRAITEGSIYHVMYYGINSMGSYAAQTTIEERWLIAQYVEQLKAKLQGVSPRIDNTSDKSNEEYLFDAENSHGVNAKFSVDHIPSFEETSIDSLEVELDEHGNVIQHKLERIGSKIHSVKKKSGKPLIGGKSHHSHKATGKK